MKLSRWILLFAFTGLITHLHAQSPAPIASDKPGWHKIGERNVDFSVDSDEIKLTGAERFSSIKFKVTGASIHLLDLEVHYVTGDKQVIEMRAHVPAGYESPVYDLDGTEKPIQKVAFVYTTLSNKKDEKAQLEVWGLKTSESVAHARTKTDESVVPSPSIMISDKKGWHKIGDRHVDLVKDRDELLVLGADRFSMIKLMVTEASIDLLELEVYFENGEQQTIPVRTPLLAGSESSAIKLNGGERSLKKIVFVYKSLPNQKGDKARVEIWGYKSNVN